MSMKLVETGKWLDWILQANSYVRILSQNRNHLGWWHGRHLKWAYTDVSPNCKIIAEMQIQKLLREEGPQRDVHGLWKHCFISFHYYLSRNSRRLNDDEGCIIRMYLLTYSAYMLRMNIYFARTSPDKRNVITHTCKHVLYVTINNLAEWLKKSFWPKIRLE